MKHFIAITSVICLLWSCSETKTAEYTLADVTVSGEYLFEGPNTLQGQPGVDLDQIAKSLEIDANAITSVTLKTATISFAPDTLRTTAESALVQWVSDDQPLVSVATRSPLPDAATVDLEVNKEQDILPYLQGTGATLVVDTNLNQDLDDLGATITMTLLITY